MTDTEVKPMACCPRDGEPLVMTFEYPGAEFVCMECNGLFGYLDPAPGDPTPERLARHAELKARYDEDYARRHPWDFPVDLATVSFDREPTVHDWTRWTIGWLGGTGVPLLDGYRVTGEIVDRAKAAWRTTWDSLDDLRDREPDPVGMQRAAAVAAAIARENPGRLPSWWHASWQAHAAQVAAASRAEMIRHQGGTGAELRVIEGCEVSLTEAQRILAMIDEALGAIEAGA